MLVYLVITLACFLATIRSTFNFTEDLGTNNINWIQAKEYHEMAFNYLAQSGQGLMSLNLLEDYLGRAIDKLEDGQKVDVYQFGWTRTKYYRESKEEYDAVKPKISKIITEQCFKEEKMTLKELDAIFLTRRYEGESLCVKACKFKDMRRDADRQMSLIEIMIEIASEEKDKDNRRKYFAKIRLFLYETEGEKSNPIQVTNCDCFHTLPMHLCL